MRGRPPPPSQPDSALPAGVPVAPALVAELRELHHEERLILTQRELLEVRAENVRLRKERVLQEVVRTTGLTGGLRIDLASGLVAPQSLESSDG
jgi:hypothetical protein